MKKILSLFFGFAILLTLASCGKKDSLYEESTSHGITQGVESTPEITSGNGESSPDISDPLYEKLQKISELRGELETQVNAVKNTEYINLHFTEDFVADVPDSDVLYDLTLTEPEPDFLTYYEKFDKIFDREFGDIYTQEDKEKLYHVWLRDIDTEYNTDDSLLTKYYDKLVSGEVKCFELYVDTKNEYLSMLFLGNNIRGLNRRDIAEYADPERAENYFIFQDGTAFYDVVKSYLDVDSEDRYAIIGSELSIKEAAEQAKKITTECEYAWGGELEPDVYQVKVLDLNNGKYGLQFSMTPSYKGVLIDAHDTATDWLLQTRGRDDTLKHNFEYYQADAFMMEDGRFIYWGGGDGEYAVTETAEYDRVISLEDATQIVSENFGTGIDFSVSRAELHYSSTYKTKDFTEKKAFPVWKFRCYNSTNNFKYVVLVNAVTGNVEYYVTDWWEV